VVQGGVAAGNGEDHERKRRGSLFQENGQDVAFEMVDSDIGDVQNVGKGLCKIETHEQGTDQTRAHGDRDPVQGVSSDAGLVQGLFDDGVDLSEVFPRSEFRNDSAVRVMELNLGVNDTGQNSAAVQHHSCGRVIARRVNAEDHHERFLFTC